MKIGILTFHMAHNYGAMLQAYALCKKIRQMDFECEVIDYRLPQIYNWHKKDNYNELIKNNRFLIATLKYIKRILIRYYTKDKRWARFNKFMLKDIGVSDITYYNESELKDLDYDIYICGSDQIWNTSLSGGVNSGYFLNFSNKDVKRISYAASKGDTIIPDDEKEQYFELLKNFDAISVREKGLVTSLENIGLKDIQLVLDPTLLLKKEDWSEIANFRDYKNYVLIYKIKDDNRIYNCARKIAKEKGYKIIEITYNKLEALEDIIQLQDCGPRDFIGLILNANYVITNSFHGTCFSIIFSKPFFTIPYKEMDDRINSLLSLLNLKDREIFELQNIDVNKDIEYDKVHALLDIKRSYSIEFLLNSLKI